VSQDASRGVTRDFTAKNRATAHLRVMKSSVEKVE